MVRSVYHPQDRDYANVGAKGINVHHPWREAFTNFERDMGQPPENGVLRRRDAAQDFTPENCYWGS